jgi:hypothetical protein
MIVLPRASDCASPLADTPATAGTLDAHAATGVTISLEPSP